MTRSVVYSPRARQQLTDLYLWIAEQSGYPDRAEGFVWPIGGVLFGAIAAGGGAIES